MLEVHHGYVAIRTRFEHFEAVVARVPKRGDRVADLECGSGIQGVLSKQAWAARVYAIGS